MDLPAPPAGRGFSDKTSSLPHASHSPFGQTHSGLSEQHKHGQAWSTGPLPWTGFLENTNSPTHSQISQPMVPLPPSRGDICPVLESKDRSPTPAVLGAKLQVQIAAGMARSRYPAGVSPLFTLSKVASPLGVHGCGWGTLSL